MDRTSQILKSPDQALSLADRMNSGIFFAVMAGCSAIFIRKYLKLHKKHELYISIVYVIAAAAFLVSWILQLTK